MRLIAIGRSEVKPFGVSTRLRSQFVYFASPPGRAGIPVLEDHEFHFSLHETKTWYDEGVFHLVSPLDTANMTEVELTEDPLESAHWLLGLQIHQFFQR